MAWNEPGKDQDPWGSGGRNNGGGPPDLDQLWRRLRARLSNKGSSDGDGGTGGGSGPNPVLLLWLIPIIAIIWLVTGFFVIQPGERAVVLRFGNYTRTVGSGWHWYWPYPVGTILSVDVQRVRSASTRGIILTRDESLAEVAVSMQYRVNEPRNYLFELTNPDLTAEQVLKSAVREIVNTSALNQVIQEGVEPEELVSEALEDVDLKKSDQIEPNNNPLATLPDKLIPAIKKQQRAYPEINRRSRALLPRNISKIVQTTLNQYDAGLHVIAINVSYAQPPEPVQSAFQEVIKAREAKERKKNLARAYAREILARARGKKASILAAAKAYKARKVAQAKGDVARFTKLLEKFEKAPQVTRRRLYLEAMGQVLGQASLVLAEESQGGPLLYLPLPEMSTRKNANRAVEQAAGSGPDGVSDMTGSASGSTEFDNQSDGRPDNLRSRGRP